jgi:hypothetical protein
MTPQETIQSKLADGVLFANLVDAVGEKYISLIHKVAKAEGWNFVPRNPGDIMSPKIARRDDTPVEVLPESPKEQELDTEEPLARKEKSATTKAIELLKSTLPADQLAAIVDALEYDDDYPFLLPFPDAPDDYDLDPWGAVYSRVKRGRGVAKLRINRFQKPKTKKWIVGYKLRVDGSREPYAPRYLAVARTIAERKWKENAG